MMMMTIMMALRMMTMIVIEMNVMIISQGLNDNGGDDIYFMMKILCVCHEK